MSTRTPRVLGMLVLVFSAACASPAASTPEVFADLPADDQTLVRFESTWQCDVARYAYADFDSIEAARHGLMSEMGVTDNAYADFKKQLDTDGVMRGHVTDVYTNECA